MKRLLMCVLLGAAAAAAQTGKPLTLEEALATARENSRLLGIVAARGEGERARADEAQASLYPGLRVTGGYQRISSGQFRLLSAPTPLPFTVGDVVEDNWTFRVGLRQPLFTGFSLSRVSEAADLQADASAFDRTMAEQDLALNVTAAYWTLYQARNVRRLTAENVARLESYVRDTERLVRAGLATRSDVLKVQLQLSNARIARIDADNDAQVAMMNLNTAMGLPPETELELSSVPGGPQEPGDAPPEALVGRAQALRSDYLAATARASAAEAAVGAARGGWWPQLELTAGYNFNSPNQRYQPLIGEFKGNWDVGVLMAFDVWNWNATGHRVEQAEAAEKQARLQQAQLRDNIALEVRRAALSLRRSREKLAVSRLGVEQAREHLRVTADRYRSGLATSTELLDAEVALLQAETQHEGARVEDAMAAAVLERAVGGPGGAVPAETGREGG